MTDPELTQKHNSLVVCATQLCDRCSLLSCDGSTKLAKQCQSELNFLRRLSKKPMKPAQLSSTNLYHLQGIVEAAETLPDVTAVLKRFHIASLQQHIVVDVVCCRGQMWVKVVARNSKALTTDLNGDGEYGCKTLVTQASEYQEAGRCHPHNFVPPRLVFLFTGQVVPAVTAALEVVGVSSESMHRVVNGTSTLSQCSQSSLSLPLPSSTQLCIQDVDRANLDVTTLILLVSNVCNGSADIPLTDTVLTQQALDEQMNPSLPVISQFLHNKHLYVCQTALHDFQSIVNIVGGPTERQRAAKLLDRVMVVPDQPSDRSLSLPVTSTIRPRARTVFGTGDNLKAVTTTANAGFVRAAAQAGVDFVTFLHPARALTEVKQGQSQQKCLVLDESV